MAMSSRRLDRIKNQKRLNFFKSQKRKTVRSRMRLKKERYSKTKNKYKKTGRSKM
jgi:hypothetical protein